MKIRLRDRVNPKDPVGAALASYDAARAPAPRAPNRSMAGPELTMPLNSGSYAPDEVVTMRDPVPPTTASPEGMAAIETALAPDPMHEQIAELNARLARLESGDPLSDLGSYEPPAPRGRRPFLEQYAARRPGAR